MSTTTLQRIVLAVLFVMTGLAPATAADERVRFGILGGVNLTNLDWSPTPVFELSGRTRASVAGFVRLPITQRVSVEGRVQYVQKGFRARLPLGDADLNATGSLNYWSFPLLLRLGFERPHVHPYAIVGGEFGFKASTRLTTSFDGSGADDPTFGDSVSGTISSLNLGGGIEIPAGPLSLLLEAIYAHGLTNVADDRESPGEVVKTRSFHVHIGVAF